MIALIPSELARSLTGINVLSFTIAAVVFIATGVPLMYIVLDPIVIEMILCPLSTVTVLLALSQLTVAPNASEIALTVVFAVDVCRSVKVNCFCSNCHC